jgi:hypothetical protein
MDEISVRYIPLNTLTAWDRNPKLHDLEQIQESIRRFGFVLPLVEDATTRRLVAGHGRREALLAMKKNGEPLPARIKERDGDWLVPVLFGVSFENEQEAEAYLLADNRLVEAGGWVGAELEAMVSRIVAGGGPEALAGTGFSIEDAEQLVEQQVEAHQGQTPEEAKVVFDAAQVKQVVLYFAATEYEPLLVRLTAAMERYSIDNHSELLLRLLDAYEQAGAK